MKTKYTYKQIWTIAYPILISLIMEQLIGMTRILLFWDVSARLNWGHLPLPVYTTSLSL